MEKQIAELLLKIGIIDLKPNVPFTWTSGIKSPIYCDCRLILSYPKERNVIVNKFIYQIKKLYPTVEAIMGTATAGIPWSAIIAQKMNLAMGYVRAEKKQHGKENTIEGKITPGIKVVVVEDLISTGGSVVKVVEILRKAGCEVLGVVSIFAYLLPKANLLFKDINCDLTTLSNYDYLLKAALKLKYIDKKDIKKLTAFKNDPTNDAWSKI